MAAKWCLAGKYGKEENGDRRRRIYSIFFFDAEMREMILQLKGGT